MTDRPTEKERVVLRVAKDDLQRIEKAAAQLGLTTAQYCKLAVFEKMIAQEGQ